MAEIEIISNDGVYYTVRVTVNGSEYIQTIISDKTGAALTAFLKAYAADYQTGIDEQQEAP